jgi:hypothetical protein
LEAHLTHIALGAVRKNQQNQYESAFMGVADIAALPQATAAYLNTHIADVSGRTDAVGTALPGWWHPAEPDEIRALRPNGNGDFSTSVSNALTRLAAIKPGTASPGLYVFIRTSSPSVVILKLDLTEQEIYRLAAQAAAEGVIEYQQLHDVLPPEGGLRKAALIPNPDGASDLRIVDDEANQGSATYWLSFLGCRSMPSAPRVLKATVEAVSAVLIPESSRLTVERAIAQTFSESEEAVATLTPQDFLTRVAETAQIAIEPEVLWQRVSEAAGPSLPVQSFMPVHTVERAIRLYEFRVGGQKVTIRGPLAALSGRVEWQPTATGYTITIQADDEPQPKLETRRGPGT